MKKKKLKKGKGNYHKAKNQYPNATIALYGPDDKTVTKIAVGIITKEGDDPEFMNRWYPESNDKKVQERINKEIGEYLKRHNVSSVVATGGIIGCPHEEGIDYPSGEKCPHCPYWAHRDRWTKSTEN